MPGAKRDILRFFPIMRLHLTQEHPSIEPAKIEAPDRHGVLLVAKLILIGATVFAAGEASWHLTGAQPTHSDLLAFDRFRRAAQNSPSAVALIGASRVLCDLDPRILKRELPKWEFYQLAINGTSALPMLENLAQDSTFRGLVLCEFNISHLFGEYPFPEREADGLRYVRFVERRPYLAFIRTWSHEVLGQNSALVAATDKDFTISLFSAAKKRLAFIVRKSSAPEQGVLLPELARREDRFLGLHRRGKDNSRAIALWARMTRTRSPANGHSGGEHIASWVQAIRRHGGDVVFIRMPVSGSLRRLEDETFPDRDRTIESLAASSINVVDSAKEPTLSGFDCPDESHLDADDAERFSAALARILEDRQLLTRAASNAR